MRRAVIGALLSIAVAVTTLAATPTPENAVSLAPAMTAAISPDGQTIATGRMREITLWDTAGKKLGTLEGHTGEIYALAFSPDGKLLASSSGWSDKTARVFDLATHKQVLSVEAPSTGDAKADAQRRIVALGFGAGNKTLVTGGSAISVFSLPDGAVTKTFAAPANEDSFVLAPDRQRVISIGKFSGELTVWDLTTGAKAAKQFAQTAESKPSMGGALSLAGDKKLVVASFMSGAVYLFDLATLSFERKIAVTGLQRASFAPDGREFAYGTWNTTGDNFVIVAGASGAATTKIGPFPKNVVFSSVLRSADGSVLVAVPNNGERPVMVWKRK